MRFLVLFLLTITSFISFAQPDLACSSNDVFTIEYPDSSTYQTVDYLTDHKEGLNVTFKFGRGKEMLDDDCDLTDINWMLMSRYTLQSGLPDLHMVVYIGQMVDIVLKGKEEDYVYWNENSDAYTILTYNPSLNVITKVRSFLPLMVGYECNCVTKTF